jgi:N-hydroxyarylamine O-acetyltransferase
MDLAAYFRRIGFQGPRVATRAVLADLVLQHTLSIPFENLDAWLGRGVNLDPDAVERKLVVQGRGGWCFEQNLLLGNALSVLGFDVTDLAARVVWGRSADAVAARTHRVLCVRLEGRQWLVDVGFGGQTLTGVLDLDSMAEQQTPHEPFRLRAVGAERLLESRVCGEWLPLFRFDLQPQQPIDFEAANYQLAHDPASHFTQELRASRVARDGRHALRGMDLVFHAIDGSTRRETLQSAADVIVALREVIGIDVSALPQLPARINAQIGSAARS